LQQIVLYLNDSASHEDCNLASTDLKRKVKNCWHVGMPTDFTFLGKKNKASSAAEPKIISSFNACNPKATEDMVWQSS
jgi:putative lipase involved disintegration of autophagic bodies